MARPIDLQALVVPDPARDEPHGLFAWASRVMDMSGSYLRVCNVDRDAEWWPAVEQATSRALSTQERVCPR